MSFDGFAGALQMNDDTVMSPPFPLWGVQDPHRIQPAEFAFSDTVRATPRTSSHPPCCARRSVSISWSLPRCLVLGGTRRWGDVAPDPKP